MQLVRIGDLLARRKEPVFIQDNKRYKRVTIRINHNGVCLRNEEIGKKIGTKRQFITRAGDFILSRIDARNAAFGLVPQELEGAIITNDFWTFEINKDLVDLEYFYTFSQSEAFLEACKKASKGTTNRKRIEEDFFVNYEFRLPDKKMQQEIVDRYKSNKLLLDHLFKENDLQLKLFKSVQQSILADAMHGKLVKQMIDEEPASDFLNRIRENMKKSEKDESLISEEEMPYELPQNWTWARFAEIADIKSNLVDPSAYLKHPHIAPDNIEKRTGKLLLFHSIQEDKVMSSNHLFFKGQILLSKVRPNLQKAVIAPVEGLCSADMYPIETVLECEFLLYYFLSPLFLLFVDKFDNRVKMPKINQNQLKSFLIPVPPIKEQKRIIKKVKQLMNSLNNAEHEAAQQCGWSEKILLRLLQDLFCDTVK